MFSPSAGSGEGLLFCSLSDLFFEAVSRFSGGAAKGDAGDTGQMGKLQSEYCCPLGPQDGETGRYWKSSMEQHSVLQCN